MHLLLNIRATSKLQHSWAKNLPNGDVFPIDPQNVVVRYCAEGIQLEQSGLRDESLRLFILAWEKCTDAFEQTIAAHYLARHQKTAEEPSIGIRKH
jgi:hypothetical protein